MPKLDPADLTRRMRALQERAAQSAHELPAGEVRARGQRRRRRRVAAVSVLAVLAVIGSGAIATGAARTFLGADRTPPAGPVPPGGWLEEIPTDFVVDADPPPDMAGAMTRGPDESLGVVEASICGEQGIDGSPEPVDQLGFRTALQWRGLTLFASDVDARTVYTEFISRADACPSNSSTDPTGDVTRYSWATPMFSESGYAVVTKTFPNDAVVFYHLTLQGNSVAVVQTGTVLSPQANVAAAVQWASGQGARAAAGLAEQLCVFTSQGCGVDVALPPWLLDPGFSSEDALKELQERAEEPADELRRRADR